MVDAKVEDGWRDSLYCAYKSSHHSMRLAVLSLLISLACTQETGAKGVQQAGNGGCQSGGGLAGQPVPCVQEQPSRRK